MHALSAEESASSELKRASFGAVFKGKLQKLPTDMADVIWEATLVTTNPCHLRPTRPKFFLRGTMTLKAGYFNLVYLPTTRAHQYPFGLSGFSK